MIEGEIFLPDQLGVSKFTSGAKRLANAVLERAALDISRYDGVENNSARTKFREAKVWIDSRDASHPFTFARVCEVLQVNESWLRERIWEEHRKGKLGDTFWNRRPGPQRNRRIWENPRDSSGEDGTRRSAVLRKARRDHSETLPLFDGALL